MRWLGAAAAATFLLEASAECSPPIEEFACGVLVPTGVRTFLQCSLMSVAAAEDAIVVELVNRIAHPTAYWADRTYFDLVDAFGTVIMMERVGLANQVALKTMSEQEVLNNLIAWVSERTLEPVPILQLLATWDIVSKAQEHCGEPVPGPAPTPAPAPEVNWPSFSSTDALLADPWSKYLQLVYGVVPVLSYPFAVQDLWIFYDNLITQVGAKAPATVGACPARALGAGQRYEENSIYEPPSTSWSWHPPPYASFSSNTWVEVIHEKDPFGDEHVGAWFLHARGSGMWLNLGNTIAFSEHDDAYAAFGAWSNEDLVAKALARGYDTIQFTSHVDHVNYPCDELAGAPYMNLEIVGTRLVGSYACTSANGAPDSIVTGWPPNFVQPCSCDNNQNGLNCDSVGRLGMAKLGGNVSLVV